MTLPVPPELLDAIPLTDKSSVRSLWERKTMNMHRGILDIESMTNSPEEIDSEVRSVVVREFKPGFIVPFAFGAVLRYASAAPRGTDLVCLIDDRARSPATWQWVIAIDVAAREVFGVHMWARGYLTPAYDAVMSHFEAHGFSVQRITKEPSKFWRGLWSTTSVLFTARKVLLGLGTVVLLVALAVLIFAKT